MIKITPILVIGSNSFSGSNFINFLLTKGFNVIGVSRSSEIETVFRPYATNPNLENFSYIQLNINSEYKEIADLVNKYKIEFVFNFAAQSMVAQSWNSPEHWYNTNVVGVSNLCNLLRNQKVIKKFVQFTTPEVYGSINGWQTESFNFDPSTPYAVSRAAGDWHLKCLFESYGFPAIFIRTANVYGPGQKLYRIIPKALLSALTGNKLPIEGGGKSIRSFIHINDVSRALFAIMVDGKIGDTYHISTNELVSIYDLIIQISSLLEINFDQLVEQAPERPGKDFIYQLSSRKIRTELGWNDEIPLQAGLTDTLQWVKLNLDYLRMLPIFYEHKK